MNRNERTRQKCRILAKNYDCFIRFIYNTLSEEENERDSKWTKESEWDKEPLDY